MYAVTSTPLDRRTRATLRSAELGFLGVMILTCKQTPFFCGQPCNAGCLGRRNCGTRGFRTNWLIVGITNSSRVSDSQKDYRSVIRVNGQDGSFVSASGVALAPRETS